MDIGDTDKLKELAYHCFLCGKCTEVCPVGIDGRAYIFNLRRESKWPEAEKKQKEKGYGLNLCEKRNYRYRNYKHAEGKSVLFPGCNFPSFYPQTTKMLTELLGKYGIGVYMTVVGNRLQSWGIERMKK